MSLDLDAKARGKREETKASNRQAIIDAARQVFAELGYGATTVRDIIRATDLASGTFYNYFKSKEEVFQALQDETALRVRPRLRAERIRARTFEEFIAGSFRTFFDFVKNDHSTFATMRRNPEMQRVRIDTPEVVAGFDELRVDLERAIESGVVPDADPDLLMASIVGVAFEIANHLVARDDIDVDDAAKFATALFLGGVQALPKRKR
ncbi:MAG: TetR/AcrR family transcriptional regulator [Alphaproteobacteria bacterium]|nr:TetR/AcrR family transcriptional regulator [Alphaproteobacteria bacterium]